MTPFTWKINTGNASSGKKKKAEKEFNQSDLEAVNRDVSHTLQHILLTVQHKWNYKNWNK